MPRPTIPLTAFTVCDTEPGSSIDDIYQRPETDWLPATVAGWRARGAAGCRPDCGPVFRPQ